MYLDNEVVMYEIEHETRSHIRVHRNNLFMFDLNIRMRIPNIRIVFEVEWFSKTIGLKRKRPPSGKSPKICERFTGREKEKQEFDCTVED